MISGYHIYTMADVNIALSDISLLIAVSFAHALQVASNAAMVGKARRKFKINPPEMNGPPEFVRTLRVQANDLEFALPFQVALWTCGLTTHQGIACVLGLLYIYGRRMYKIGYIEDAQKRVPGFKLSVYFSLRVLGVFTTIGIINMLVSQYAGVDGFGLMKAKILEQIAARRDEL